jgi:NAD(P)H-dependent FMN reductase
MREPLKVGLIYGSARAERRCDAVAGWIKRRLSAWHGAEIDVFDPRQPEVAEAIYETSPLAVKTLLQRIEKCDAFIVVTPEYNHSYPAPLKALIDTARFEWAAKAVAFVSYGGSSGGARAVEHLRNVFAELHATSIRNGVLFTNIFEALDEQGEPHEAIKADRALELMRKQLEWWALALKQARVSSDYREVAG